MGALGRSRHRGPEPTRAPDRHARLGAARHVAGPAGDEPRPSQSPARLQPGDPDRPGGRAVARRAWKLSAAELKSGNDTRLHTTFQKTTPLWFYVLKEAGGEGRRRTRSGRSVADIVAETIVGQVRADPGQLPQPLVDAQGRRQAGGWSPRRDDPGLPAVRGGAGLKERGLADLGVTLRDGGRTASYGGERRRGSCSVCAPALGSCRSTTARRLRADVDRHRRLGRRLPGLRRRRGRDALLQRAPTTAETTSASVDNLFLVADGDSDVAFSLADTAIDAVKGQDSFDGEPLPLRALGTLYSNFTHVVALKSTRDRADRGPGGQDGLDRRAQLRHRGDRPAADGGRRARSGHGRDPALDGRRGVGAALREGSIDAFVWSGGLPTGAITDLATTDEIVLLPLDRYLASSTSATAMPTTNPRSRTASTPASRRSRRSRSRTC